MGGELNIYDVSPFVYVGASSKRYADKQQYGFPVGGIRYLLEHITKDIHYNNHIALCFDSGKGLKRSGDTYKVGRARKSEVFIQLDFLYEFLPSCGIQCYKRENTEADTLIFNCVEQLKKKYNSIKILGVDYDLCHNIDESVVSFESISTQVNSIKSHTFEYGIISGQRIKFNTISAYKVFCGDSSDSIKPFVSSRGIKGAALYAKYCQALNTINPAPNGSAFREEAYLDRFIELIKSVLTPQDLQTLTRRKHMIFPKILSGDFSQISTPNSINKKNLHKLTTLCGSSVAWKNLDYEGPAELTNEDRKGIFNYAEMFKTGAYAIDRDLPVNRAYVPSELINLGEF